MTEKLRRDVTANAATHGLPVEGVDFEAIADHWLAPGAGYVRRRSTTADE